MRYLVEVRLEKTAFVFIDADSKHEATAKADRRLKRKTYRAGLDQGASVENAYALRATPDVGERRAS